MDNRQVNHPRYRELPVTRGLPHGSGWHAFGLDDELGTLNHLAPARVAAAAKLVQTGERIGLQLPLDHFKPGIGARVGLAHQLLHVGWRRNGPNAGDDLSGADGIGEAQARDDYLDRFWLQGSSQWDGLGHFRHPEHGNYNGIPDADIHAGAGARLGVDRWAAGGIIGRGVLVDLAASFERRGQTFDVASPFNFRRGDVERAAEEQGLDLRPGDVLILRTGWMRAHAAAAAGDRIRTQIVCAGLEPSDETAEFLWDGQFAAVAADNCSVESCPSPAGGYQFPLHCILLPLFGMPIGEFWDLERLAAACRRLGRYEFFFVSVPLNLTGGIGSPCQAVAVL